MTKGPHRLVLDHYIDTASEGALTGAGDNWTQKAVDLDTLGAALKKAAEQAELRIGEQTLTGPAVRASMEESAASLALKSQQLQAAGTALTHVGQQLADTRESRDSLADLGAKPSPYQPPAGTPGVEPTSEELQAQADASQARSNERSAWQTQYDKQEAKSLALTKEMDAAFLAAIPPMKEIHGQEDPTEPPPSLPSGPSGPYLPGTQAPPATGGGAGGGGGTGGGGGGGGKDASVFVGAHPADNGGGNGNGVNHPTPTTTVTTQPITGGPSTHPPLVHTEGPTSTVTGTSQNGITPTGGQVPTPVTGGGGSTPGSVSTAAAFGAAGGAGAMSGGAIRPGAAPTATTRGTGPVRAIGSTGKAGSPGALSRSAGSAGSPASRSAAGRGAGTGSTAGRGATGGAGGAGRGAPGSSTATRGSAGGRGGTGAGSAKGAANGSTGSRSGGRGAGGARTGGAGAGAGAGRGGRKGEREQTTDRDSLVYDQDWLGDDDVAPGVLD